MLLLQVLFWLCALGLLYAYVVYPVVLRALKRDARHIHGEDELPPISVVVAAHNEEHCIADKIADTLEHDYPAELVTLIVVSDGSTDSTESIVADCGSERVTLLVQATQQGKNEALNLGLRECQSRIVVFSDANAMMAKGALRALVAPFNDPDVGLVSGQGLYGEQIDGTTRAVSNAYAKYECLIKKLEATLGFVSAADGALYAVDRHAVEPIPPDHVHDLMHPIQVCLSGKRCDFVPQAHTTEPSSEDARAELRRHVRIIAQGFVVMFSQLPRLVSRRRFLAIWILLSHRLSRWSAWLFMLGALVTNGLVLDVSPLYRWLFVLQLTFYGCAAAGALAERFDIRLRVVALPYYFCVVAAAGFYGLLAYLRGGRFAAWAPAESG